MQLCFNLDKEKRQKKKKNETNVKEKQWWSLFLRRLPKDTFHQIKLVSFISPFKWKWCVQTEIKLIQMKLDPPEIILDPHWR